MRLYLLVSLPISLRRSSMASNGLSSCIFGSPKSFTEGGFNGGDGLELMAATARSFLSIEAS